MRPSASRRSRPSGESDRSTHGGNDGSGQSTGLFGWLGSAIGGILGGGGQPSAQESADGEERRNVTPRKKRALSDGDDSSLKSSSDAAVPLKRARGDGGSARQDDDIAADDDDDLLEHESKAGSAAGDYAHGQSQRLLGLSQGASVSSSSPLRYSGHGHHHREAGAGGEAAQDGKADRAATVTGGESRRSRLANAALLQGAGSPGTLGRAAGGTSATAHNGKQSEDSAATGTAHHGPGAGAHPPSSGMHGYSTAAMLAAARLAGDASAAGQAGFGLAEAAEFQRLMVDPSRRLPPSPPLQAEYPKASQPWGNLLSLNANYPHVTLSGSKFTIGRHWRCNLQLLDPNISRLFCRLVFENGTVWVESLSKNGKLYVNDKLVMPNTKQVLRPGDEITIIASTRVQYIFEMTEPSAYAASSNNASAAPPVAATAAAVAAAVAAASSKIATISKSVARRPARTQPPSLLAPADTAARPGPSPGVAALARPPEDTADALAGEKLARNVRKSLGQISKGLTEKFQRHVVSHKDIDVKLDDFPYYLHDEFRQRLVHAVYIYLKHPDYVKHTKALTTMSRGLMLVGPPGTELMQLAVVKALAAHLEVNLLVLTSDMLNLSQAVSNSVLTEITAGLASDVSAGRAQGVDTASVMEDDANLAQTDGIKSASAATVVAATTTTPAPDADHRQQREGASQEDTAVLPGDKEEPLATPLAATKVSAAGRDEVMSELGDGDELETSPTRQGWMDGAEPVEEAQRLVAELKSKVSIETAPEDDEAQAGPGETYAPSIERPAGGGSRDNSDDDEDDAQKADNEPMELAEAAGDDVGGDDDEEDSNLGEDYADDGMDEDDDMDEAIPQILDDMEEEAADPVLKAMNKELRAFKKTYVFRKGDQVRYVGRGGSMGDGPLAMGRPGLGGLGDSSSSWFFHHMSSSSSRHGLLSHSKTPPINAEGTVVMTFPGNTRKIGVSFKQAYPGSVPIESHENCFFLSADELKVVGAHQSPDEVAISALFQTLVKNAPCILFLRESDKALFASNDRYHEFKLELSKLEKPVVVIGSSIALTSSAAVPKPPTSKREKGFLQFVLMERNLFSHSAQKAAHPSKRTPLARLLPNKLIIRPPTEHAQLEEWDKQIKKDTMQITLDANMRRLRSVVARNNVKLNPEDEARVSEAVVLREKVLSGKAVDMLVGWAISHHLKHNVTSSFLPAPLPVPALPSSPAADTATSDKLDKPAEAQADPAVEGESLAKTADATQQKASSPEAAKDKEKDKSQLAVAKQGKKKTDPLALPWGSLEFSLAAYSTLTESRKERRSLLQEIQTDNDYEKSLLSNVIPSDQIGVTFKDIGALTKVKNTLFELVILPLVRPELFTRGNLTKPLKGILLFGPPGTGKTLLAKAVAVQSGANFLNISVSSITSKWVGEGEKYAKAVFTLASKITPCVIFIDEIDSLLGRRDSQYEHEGMRKIKNEFMSMWDGLTTKANERVIVLAATNRPFDLDDAVLRRLPRRLLVDLPDVEQREQILRVLLRSETLEPDFDFPEVAKILEGYSGSDIRNLCVAAAYQPIREIIVKENMVERMQNEGLASVRAPPPQVTEELGSTVDSPRPDAPLAASVHVKEHRKPPSLRELTFHDFEMAKKEVSASCSENAPSQTELRKWNETFGESTNTWKTSLTYFS